MIKYLEKEFNSLMDSNGKINSKEPLNNLKEEIEIAHSEQKIEETRFNLLIEKISIGRRLMEIPKMENKRTLIPYGT